MHDTINKRTLGISWTQPACPWPLLPPNLRQSRKFWLITRTWFLEMQVVFWTCLAPCLVFVGNAGYQTLLYIYICVFGWVFTQVDKAILVTGCSTTSQLCFKRCQWINMLFCTGNQLLMFQFHQCFKSMWASRAVAAQFCHFRTPPK